MIEKDAAVIEPIPDPYVSKIDPKVMDQLFKDWKNVPREPKKNGAEEEEKKDPGDVKMRVGNVTRDGRI